MFNKFLRRMACISQIVLGCLMLHSTAAHSEEARVFKPVTTLVAPEIKDQDDMCVWVHPTAPANSTVVCSDKSAGALFVYDLDGKLLQQIPESKPGNIDLRQAVRFDGKLVDLVVLNQRAGGFKLRVYKVDAESRKLERLDDDHLLTGPNYGGCLYLSAKSRLLYFICTSDKGTVEQYEIQGNGQGGVRGRKVREFPLGKCEGAVADDQAAALFIGEEKGGVWKFPAEPDADAQGTLVIKVGEHGLKGDVEGLALSHGHLVVSDQGNNRFATYQREAPHSFVGSFQIEGAKETDGIEICVKDLGPRFPKGLFACHTGVVPRGVLLTPLDQVLSANSATSK